VKRIENDYFKLQEKEKEVCVQVRKEHGGFAGFNPQSGTVAALYRGHP
jgi:hypothetical protein